MKIFISRLLDFGSLKRPLLILTVVLLAVCATMAGIQPDLNKRNSAQYPNLLDLVRGESCQNANINRAAMNIIMPTTWEEARNNENLILMSPTKSILHNFQEGISLETKPQRAKAMLQAFWEYFCCDRSKWTVLDPDLPNVKYVTKDGHEEYVFNMRTGELVNRGINQGTPNKASPKDGLNHMWSDMFGWIDCGTPTEFEAYLGQALADLEREQKLSNNILQRILREMGGEEDQIQHILDQRSERNKRNNINKTDSSEPTRGLTTQTKLKQNQSGLGNSQSIRDIPKEATPKETRDIDVDTQVGVRGWCHCEDNQNHLEMVGVGMMDDESETQGDFIYFICNKCGQCDKRWTLGGDGCVRKCHFIDMRVFRRCYSGSKRLVSTAEYERLLLEADRKLLAIPDGQIVVPGKCACEKPDPVKMGLFLSDSEAIYVCIECGRVRLPDANGGMPVGPTQWRAMMGESAPFPGYGK